MKSKTKVNAFLIIWLAFIMCCLSSGFVDNFAKAESISFSGQGVVENPYLIEDIDDLKTLANQVNSGNNYDNTYFKLVNDIDLEGEDWTPIGTSSAPFCGMFDGDNHIVKNLQIQGSKEYGTPDAKHYVGLFGYLKGDANSGIKNIIIENANVSGCLYVGAVLGRSYTGGIIENCHVRGDIKVEAYSYAGIIVGRHEYSSGLNVNGQNMSMYNCSVVGGENTATISCDYAVSYVGGIVGFLAEGNYQYEGLSVENIEVKGTYGVGGISGIGHYGNTFKNISVEEVDVISIDNDPESARTGNVGLVVGACQGTQNQKTVFKDYEIINSDAKVNGEEVKTLFGNNMNGSAPITNFVVKVNDYDYYETILDASVNAQVGDRIVLVGSTSEIVELPAGVNFDTNGFTAENVTVEPLEIADIKVERNAENTATIVTIIYLNCEKPTTVLIPDGKDGINGENGKDGLTPTVNISEDGYWVINGNKTEYKAIGQNGFDGKNGQDANNTLLYVGLIASCVSLICCISILIYTAKKKR